VNETAATPGSDAQGQPAPRAAGARVLRVAVVATVALLVLFATALTALRVLLASVPQQAGRIEAWVERQTGLRLEYSTLDARLRWYGPEIVLRDLRVLDRDRSQALVTMREGSVALDLWNFLRRGEFVAGRVNFDAPSLSIVRLEDGRIRLVGLADRPADRPPFDLDRLPAGRLVVSDATVRVRDFETSRGPWTITGLDIVLRRDRDETVATGVARLPDALGEYLRFEGRLDGSLHELDRLNARLQFRADGVRLAGLTGLLPARLAQPAAGSGHVDGTVVLDSGRLARLRLTPTLKGVVLRLPVRQPRAVEAVEYSRPYRSAGASALAMPMVDKHYAFRPPPVLPKTITYPILAFDLDLERAGDAWSFKADGLRIARVSGVADAPARISGRWRGRPAASFDFALDADRVQLEDLWPLALAYAPRSADPWLALAPSGEIERLRLVAARSRSDAAPEFTVDAKVENVGFAPSGRWPGLHGLTATVTGTDRAGRAVVRSRSLDFTWPFVYTEPVGDAELRGDLAWKRDGSIVRVNGTGITFRHPLAYAHGVFAFETPGDRPSPVLDLKFEVDHADAALVRQLLPLSHLRPRTVAWLQRAFVAGGATDGTVVYDGPVRSFPFRNGEGEFRASLDAHDAALDYFEGFTPLSGASGHVEFHNGGLSARLDAGRIGGLRIRRGSVEIPDFSTAVIDIDADVSGDLGSALDYLHGSPLGPVIGRQFMQLSGNGATDFAVRLHLPTPDMDQRSFQVRAALDAANLALPALHAPVQGVSGTLTIDEHGAQSDGVHGTLLGGQFAATVATDPAAPDDEPSVLIRGQGHAAGAQLPAFIGLPAGIVMSGAAGWNLELRSQRVRSGDSWPMRIAVDSDLRGLAIDAPAPFAKTVAEMRATEFVMQTDSSGANDIRVRSGSAQARLAFAYRRGRQEFDRGAVRFDGGPLTMPTRAGLQVVGDWPDFDLAEWLALGQSGIGSGSLASWLGAVDVRLDRAQVYGYEFHDVTAALQPLGDHWQVDVAGPDAQGRITVPYDTGSSPIALDLARLHLEPAAAEGGSAGSAADPRRVAAIDVRAGDFVWQGRNFGRLDAEIRPDPAGVRVTRLVTTAPDFNISLYGSWLADGNSTRSRLDATLTSTDLASASRALGYRDSIEAEQSVITAHLDWPGGPTGDVIARMGGKIQVALERGQLRNVKPGAGRVLGLMSVSDLPRRLALDFRDVTDEGLAFNTVHGDFEVRDGSAYTQNLLLKGAAVDIGVAGRTGLAEQDYDQTLVVSGNPSGPLAVAGALAAGPVIGAGVLVLSQLFKGQLTGLTRAYYHVTGPWSDPVVERVSGPSEASLASAPGDAVEPASGKLAP
jgi:uncharacterized protein (TIGR02099 family)